MGEFTVINLVCQPCCMCGKQNEVKVLLDDYKRYMAGAPVQAAFPEMPADQREMIISGTCPPCFDRLFPPD